ncbi:MAG TPA: hypothetical protein G4O08_01865 [Anaerolineae bacterium]|nr:hypothetical protein [Anaerolineae bacterium]
MSFRRFILILTLLAILIMAARVSVDTDTWWHLRAGSWMVENGSILRTDPFSLTRQGQDWIYPGWLAQVALFGVYQAMGYAGLNLFTALMVVLALSLLWPAMDGPPLMKAFVLVLAATASGVYWAARPHILSFVFSAAFLLILEHVQRGRLRLLWVLPPLMALWVNVHGGFAFGFMFLVLVLAGEVVDLLIDIGPRKRRLAEAWQARKSIILGLVLVGLGCALACMLNPHGPQMLLYPFKTVSIGVLREYIQEWQSPDFHQLELQPFLLMLFLSMGALALSPRRKTAAEMLLLFVLAAMSLVAARNIAQFALIGAIVLARHVHAVLDPLLSDLPKGKQVPERLARTINILLLLLAAALAVIKIASVSTVEINQQAIDDRHPTQAVAYLQDHLPEGPLLNSYNWGGYVVWELYPDYLSFVDGRTDLFDDEILNDYLRVWRTDPYWEGVLERWDIRLTLLEPEAPLNDALLNRGWQQLYADEQAVVLAWDGSE